MQDNNSPDRKASDAQAEDNQKDTVEQHKHNPFEDKNDTLTKEEEDAIEQFKEAQTERD